MMHRTLARTLAGLGLCLAPPAFAADAVVQLGAGDSFVIQDSVASEKLRADESGDLWRNGLRFLHTPGSQGTGLGQNALASSTGAANTAFGHESLLSNSSGGNNAAFGSVAMGANTTGGSNAAFGGSALRFNVSGSGNAAFGFEALYMNTGGFNSAFGYNVMRGNTTGTHNAAFGASALGSANGSRNAAFGSGALTSIDGGNDNAGFGYSVLAGNTSGADNAGVGRSALVANTTGARNAVLGSLALDANVSGNDNVAVGYDALGAIAAGIENLAIGRSAGSSLTSGSFNVYLAHPGVATESSTIRIGQSQGAAYLAGVSGSVVTGSPVLVDAGGRLGVAASSARFKRAVRDLDEADALLMKLRPVSFRYREDAVDEAGGLQYGLIAEEVAEVEPDLVSHDEQGRPFAVHYRFLAPLLLSQVQQQQREIEAQAALIGRLEARLARLEAEREPVGGR